MMMTLEQMYIHLIEKAGKDVDFRAHLVADPNSIISQEFGIDVPDEMRIVVHESDMNTVHFSLPPTLVLSEEQLEAAAGGACATS